MRRARLIVLLAALSAVAVFVLPARDGRPMLDFGEVTAKLRATAPHFRPASDGSTVSGGDGGGVYKWRGEDGTWHYSNVRPEGRRDVQRVEETVTWARGSGGADAAGAADPARPRSAAELLAESERLEGRMEGRETELQGLLAEANP